MKNVILNRLLTVCLLLVSQFLFAQNDSIQRSTLNEDSIKIVVPVPSDATLNLITPPEGFEVSTGFNGYINIGFGSAIIMTMIEHVHYEKMKEGMTPEYFEQNKLVLISETDFETEAGYKGVSYKLTFTLQELEYIRYLVFAGDESNTLWLNITYPKEVEDFVETGILKCIQSVNLNPVKDEE